MTKKAMAELTQSMVTATRITIAHLSDGPDTPEDEARTLVGMAMRHQIRSIVAGAAGCDEDQVVLAYSNDAEEKTEEKAEEAATEPVAS